jgi:hypothetical protein
MEGRLILGTAVRGRNGGLAAGELGKLIADAGAYPRRSITSLPRGFSDKTRLTECPEFESNSPQILFDTN